MKSMPTYAFLLALCAAGLGCSASELMGNERSLAGIAPTGTTEILVIDTSGTAFRTTPDDDGGFILPIASTRPVTAFLVSPEEVRVLRVAPSPDAMPTQSVLPSWNGQVSTKKLSTCDCNEDGLDDDAAGEENVLAQIDSDGDGVSDLEDTDDDDDGIADNEDDDSDGSGEDDEDEDLDRDNDGRPDYIDDDDDNDGIRDDDDVDDDNDGEDDEDEDEDEDDGESEDTIDPDGG
ncbi:MAG: hypothetical protein ACO3JL_21600, partial [Myxococcota bacterium]